MAAVREAAERGESDGALRYRLIAGSELRAAVWEPLGAATHRLGESFRPPLSKLLTLSTLLSAVSWPSYAEWDAGNCVWRVYDPRYVLGVISPQVSRLLAELRREDGLLADVSDPFEDLNRPAPDAAAIELHKEILTTLARPAGPPLVTHPPNVGGRSASPTGEVIPGTVDGQQSVAVANPDEYQRLLKLKTDIDKEDTYIGRSSLILRVFERIRHYNTDPSRPVVLHGPSRSGKTVLAELIHKSSTRKDKPYLPLSASTVRSEDSSTRLSRWVGYGKNSGLSGTHPRTTKTGWLQQTAGGTIFLDELQDLDQFTQEFLRQVLDRTRIALPAGEGDPVVPDVRLVFATNRTLASLVSEGRLRQDFVNRLNDRLIEIPSVDDRKDDIPLFVERFRGGKVPTSGFLLCLLRHSWAVGQVDLLVDTIKEAVVLAQEGKYLTIDHLRQQSRMRETVTALAQMTEDQAKCEVLEFLVTSLERQGFSRDTKSGLGVRVAKILAISQGEASKRLHRCGLRG